ncbi:MAG: NAD(P)-dependent oxidoreductase [Chitinophagaceae bacterium]|nr:NAD(P)-dependent oxidoreductase [Chitinophagaceae bacterium]
MSFRNRTILITGASRGIGKAIALKLAKEGANIVIAAKSVEEDPRLGGTIFSAAAEVEAAGGHALAVQVDIRHEDQIEAMVAQAIERFGGIDVVINNASAIQLTPTDKTETKRFDLMQSINVRGTFLVVKHCLPWLRKGNNPHIITLSPPINLDPRWLGGHIAYTLTKYNMSMLALGWAAEFKSEGIASNALWPRTTIDTAAVRNLLGGEALARMSRTPDILADAVHIILNKKAAECSGHTFIDEEVLAMAGVTDLDHYSVVPGATLYNDLFV